MVKEPRVFVISPKALDGHSVYPYYSTAQMRVWCGLFVNLQIRSMEICTLLVMNCFGSSIRD